MQGTNDSEDMVQSEKDARLRKEAVAWVIRLQSAAVSQEERMAFDAWQTRSSTHRLMFQRVLAVWNSPELHAAAIMAVEPSSVSATPKTAHRRRWLMAAACITLFVIAADRLDLVTRWRADYQTGVGERRTVELPDRSTVTLNTRSAIALSFDDRARRVRLFKGEALFTVQHDAARPFLVEGTETAVRAVGTAFVVRTEPRGDQVTVLEGTVEVETHTKTVSDTVVVTAGSQIKMENGSLGRPYSVNVPSVSAWLRGRLVVNGVPFAQVLEELRRYHSGTIVLWNRRVGETDVTGTYDMDDPVAALELLVKTVPVSMIGLTDRFVLLF